MSTPLRWTLPFHTAAVGASAGNVPNASGNFSCTPKVGKISGLECPLRQECYNGECLCWSFFGLEGFPECTTMTPYSVVALGIIGVNFALFAFVLVFSVVAAAALRRRRSLQCNAGSVTVLCGGTAALLECLFSAANVCYLFTQDFDEVGRILDGIGSSLVVLTVNMLGVIWIDIADSVRRNKSATLVSWRKMLVYMFSIAVGGTSVVFMLLREYQWMALASVGFVFVSCVVVFLGARTLQRLIDPDSIENDKLGTEIRGTSRHVMGAGVLLISSSVAWYIVNIHGHVHYKPETAFDGSVVAFGVIFFSLGWLLYAAISFVLPLQTAFSCAPGGGCICCSCCSSCVLFRCCCGICRSGQGVRSPLLGARDMPYTAGEGVRSLSGNREGDSNSNSGYSGGWGGQEGHRNGGQQYASGSGSGEQQHASGGSRR